MIETSNETSKKQIRHKRAKGRNALITVELETEATNEKSAADNSSNIEADDGVDDNVNDKIDDEPSKKRKRKRKRKIKIIENDDNSNKLTTDGTPLKNNLDNTSHTVYIEGLPFTSTEADVRSFLQSHGCTDILQLRLPTWQDSGRLRGFGHVVFGSLKAKERALSADVNGKELGGRYVSVMEAKAPRSGLTNGAIEVRDQPTGCRTVFVRNLPYEATEEQILENFRVCGKILEDGVRIARNYANGQSKGFCYIEFKNAEGAYAAVQKAAKPSGLSVLGRPVFVDYDEGLIKGSFRNSEGKLWSKEHSGKNNRSGGKNHK